MWAGGIPTQGRAERGKEKEVDKLKIHTTHMKCMRKVNYISSSANILIKLQIQIHAHQPFYFFSRKTKKTARTYKYACDSFAQERVDNSSPFNVVLLPLIPIHLSLSIGWLITPTIWEHIFRTLERVQHSYKLCTQNLPCISLANESYGEIQCLRHYKDMQTKEMHKNEWCFYQPLITHKKCIIRRLLPCYVCIKEKFRGDNSVDNPIIAYFPLDLGLDGRKPNTFTIT